MPREGARARPAPRPVDPYRRDPIGYRSARSERTGTAGRGAGTRDLPHPGAPGAWWDEPDAVTPAPAPPSIGRQLGGGRRVLGRPPRVARSTKVLLAIAAVLAAWILVGLWQWTRVEVDLVGLADGDAVTPEASESLALAFAVETRGAGNAVLRLDGEVQSVERGDDGSLRWAPGEALAEGDRVLELSVPRPILAPAVFRWHFEVDGTPPVVDLPESWGPVPIGEPVIVAGRTEPGAVLFVDGREVPVDPETGVFEARWDRPPLGPPVAILARDPAGNEYRSTLSIPVAYPEVRGVHVRAEDWAAKREELLELADAGLITTVQLDLKDEAGIVGYRTGLDAVHEVGAAGEYYDLADAVRELHEHGIHIIGRVVAFLDPIYGQAAWDRGDRDQVVQTDEGEPLERGEGMFLNFAHPEVRDYVQSVAAEAASYGVDDIMFDYIRRPDGAIESMYFAGLRRPPPDEIVDFLAESRRVLAEHSVFVGAAVFGIAGTEWRGGPQIAQDVRSMAGYLDYVAPMVYPSHWGRGEYNVASPNEEPYDIVVRSLRDFQLAVEHRGIAIVPWLQDFSYAGVTYDAEMVRAQIDAACDVGVYHHLLWNARSNYTVDALGKCP